MRFYCIHLGICRRNESKQGTLWDTVLCFAVSSKLTAQSKISNTQARLQRYSFSQGTIRKVHTRMTSASLSLHFPNADGKLRARSEFSTI